MTEPVDNRLAVVALAIGLAAQALYGCRGDDEPMPRTEAPPLVQQWLHHEDGHWPPWPYEPGDLEELIQEEHWRMIDEPPTSTADLLKRRAELRRLEQLADEGGASEVEPAPPRTTVPDATTPPDPTKLLSNTSTMARYGHNGRYAQLNLDHEEVDRGPQPNHPRP